VLRGTEDPVLSVGAVYVFMTVSQLLFNLATDLVSCVKNKLYYLCVRKADSCQFSVMHTLLVVTDRSTRWQGEVPML
jgi:hypothetical protein